MNRLRSKGTSTTAKDRRDRKDLTLFSSKTLLGALLVIAVIVVAVIAVANRPDQNEAYFAQMKEALVSIGAPVIDAEVYEAKSGLSSYLIVSAIVDDTVQVVEEPLLKSVIMAVAREAQENPSPIVIGIRHVDSAALDTETAAEALGLPDSAISISGRISMTHSELTQFVQQ